MNLRGCVNDAIEMRDVLTNERTGIINADNAFLMLNEQAKKSDIIKLIHEVVSKLEGSDTLTIYWASHGSRPKEDEEELYLVTHDTIVKDEEMLNSIKFIEELVPMFEKLNNYIIVILDGCYVGDALARPIIAENKNIGIMSATKREETALEDSRLNHGVFTYHLLLTLNSIDADADNDGYLSMEEAHVYTYKPVLDYVAKNFPRHQQHPTVAGNNIHRMKLIQRSVTEDSIRAR
jgi:uncharacterized caspase-like protein